MTTLVTVKVPTGVNYRIQAKTISQWPNPNGSTYPEQISGHVEYLEPGTEKTFYCTDCSTVSFTEVPLNVKD